MSTPSLLNIPYLYKAGTLYSQIPESGAGDFTVQRTTTVANRSTRINKDGFIETVLDNVPRLDYPLGGAVNGCPALLVEPAATNLHTQSEAFASNYATVLNLSASGTNLTAPDNSATADRYFETTANDVHLIAIGAGGGFPITSGLVYTTSVFVKAIGGRNFRIIVTVGGASENVLYTLSGSGSVSIPSIAKIESYGNDWYRCSLTFTATSSVNFRQNLYSVSGTTNNFIGDPSKGIILWGAQLETGSVATSYIPTTTAAVTRSADVVSKTGVSSLIGQTEGTIYVDINRRDNSTPNRRILSIGTGSNFDNRIEIVCGGTGNANKITCIMVTSGVTQFNQQSSADFLGDVKVALSYSSAGFSFYINGNVIASGTTAITPPTVNSVGLGQVWNTAILSNVAFNDRIRAVALYPNRLTNAELATLTAL